MNTILFSRRHHLGNNQYVIPFICTDLKGIRVELSRLDRSEAENKVLDTIQDRITLALQKYGFDLYSLNFSSMSITAIDVKSIKESGK